MRPIGFFLGAQKGGFGQGRKVYVEEVYVLFLSKASQEICKPGSPNRGSRFPARQRLN